MKRILAISGVGALLFVAACHLNAPTDLSATAISPTRIDLTWSDTAEVEDDWHIESSPDGVTFTELTTVVYDSTSYSDTTVPCGTTRYYQVRPHSTVTDEFGDYSNVASATTPGCGAPVCTKVKTDWRAPYADGTCPSGTDLHSIATVESGGIVVCTKVKLDWRAPDNAGCPDGFSSVRVATTTTGGLPVCVKKDLDWRDPYADGTCPATTTKYRVVEASAPT